MYGKEKPPIVLINTVEARRIMTDQRKVWITAESFGIDEKNEKDGITVKGLALPFDRKSRNGGTYDKERTTQIADTLKNKPVLFNHDENRVVGHITGVSVDDTGVYYEANIDPEEVDVVRKLKRGDVSTASIQGIVDEVEEDNNIKLDEFVEMSFVTIPGFGETNVTSIEKLLKKESKEAVAKEPFAGFKNWDDCISQMKKDQGYDDETAKKVCGALKKKYEEVLNGDDREQDSEVSNKYEQTEITNMSKTEKRQEKTKVKEQEDEEKPKEKPEEKPEEEQDSSQEDFKKMIEEFSGKLEKAVGRLDTIEERLSKLEETGKNPPEEGPEESVTSNVPVNKEQSTREQVLSNIERL